MKTKADGLRRAKRKVKGVRLRVKEQAREDSGNLTTRNRNMGKRCVKDLGLKSVYLSVTEVAGNFREGGGRDD